MVQTSESGEKYLELRDEGIKPSVDTECAQLYTVFDDILKEFKALDCSCCGVHFGYQHRTYPKIKVCNSQCLGIVYSKLRPQTKGIQTESLKNENKRAEGIPSDTSTCLLESSQDTKQCSVLFATECKASAVRIRPRPCEKCPQQVKENSKYGGAISHHNNGSNTTGYSTGSDCGVHRPPGFYNYEGDVSSLETSYELEQNSKDSLVEKCWNQRQLKDEIDVSRLVSNKDTKEVEAYPATNLQEARSVRTCEKAINLELESGPGVRAPTQIEVKKKKKSDDAPIFKPAPKLVRPMAVTRTRKPKPIPIKKIWRTGDIVPSLSFVKKAPCSVSFMWDMTKFTINALADVEKIEKLQSEIAEYSTSSPPLTRVPAVDDIVFAPYDGVMYRGLVDAVQETESKVNVVFIDFGDRAHVNLEHCREPCDKIMKKHPMYGMIITLRVNASVPSVVGKISKEIQKIVDEDTFYLATELQPHLNLNGEWSGITLFLDNHGKKTLNDVLEQFIVTHCLAPAWNEPAEPPIFVPHPKKVSRQSFPPAALTSVPKIDRSTNNFPAGKEKSTRKTIHDSETSPNMVSGAVVRINFVWNDGMISISAEDDDDGLALMSELVAEHVKNAPNMARIPDVDEILIAPYNGFYYRGRITAINGDMVRVRFVDWGDDSEVSYSELRELNYTIAQSPIYGVVFRMAGVPDTNQFTQYNTEVAAALAYGGQIEEVETDLKVPGELTGKLWVGNDRTWNDIVLEVMREVANKN